MRRARVRARLGARRPVGPAAAAPGPAQSATRAALPGCSVLTQRASVLSHIWWPAEKPGRAARRPHWHVGRLALGTKEHGDSGSADESKRGSPRPLAESRLNFVQIRQSPHPSIFAVDFTARQSLHSAPSARPADGRRSFAAAATPAPPRSEWNEPASMPISTRSRPCSHDLFITQAVAAVHQVSVGGPSESRLKRTQDLLQQVAQTPMFMLPGPTESSSCSSTVTQDPGHAERQCRGKGRVRT